MVIVLGAAGGFVYLFQDPVRTAVGSWLIVEDPVETADAIKVMAGDFPAVLLEAVDLYRSGEGKAIVFSPETRPAAWDELEKRGVHAPFSADLNRSSALQLGVAEEDIWVLGPPVQTSREELGVLKGLLIERGVRRLIIVATKPHTRRCRLIAREVLVPEIQVAIKPSRYDDFDPSNWIENRFYFKSVVNEYQKLVNDGLHIVVR